jgi:argininosuccinate lyase
MSKKKGNPPEKMKKLWQGQSGDSGLDPRVEAFCFTRDVELDANLVYHDIIGSLAQAKMLEKIGVLDQRESKTLRKGLITQWRSFQKGEWEITVAEEDVHTAIEGRLTSGTGLLKTAGEKLHTARSRNDQVLTDMRLYCKDHLHGILSGTLTLAGHMAKVAKKYEFIPMPGYTHLQRAMPMSFGMWMGNFAEALLDTVQEMTLAYDLLDQSPLGSGAGYGVSLKIDRKLTAKLMGFAKVQSNSLYCQNSRGHFEAVMLSSLTSLMGVIGRLSSDVCLFCSEEFKFLNLPDAFFTGSSIMPQKKNPDLFELLRAKVVSIQSLESRVRGVTHGIGSGYSKDLQEVKEPVMEALSSVEQALDVLNAVVPDLGPNRDRLQKAMSPELFAAHRAYEYVEKEGLPFRQAYNRVKGELDQLGDIDPKQAIREMQHIGATGNLGLKDLIGEIGKLSRNWSRKEAALRKAWGRLMEVES